MSSGEKASVSHVGRLKSLSIRVKWNLSVVATLTVLVDIKPPLPQRVCQHGVRQCA